MLVSDPMVWASSVSPAPLSGIYDSRYLMTAPGAACHDTLKLLVVSSFTFRFRTLPFSEEERIFYIVNIVILMTISVFGALGNVQLNLSYHLEWSPHHSKQNCLLSHTEQRRLLRRQ